MAVHAKTTRPTCRQAKSRAKLKIHGVAEVHEAVSEVTLILHLALFRFVLAVYIMNKPQASEHKHIQ